MDLLTFLLAEKYAGKHGGGGISTNADWNENDPTSGSYIKHRPFGKTSEDVEVEVKITAFQGITDTAVFPTEGMEQAFSKYPAGQYGVNSDFGLGIDITNLVIGDSYIFSIGDDIYTLTLSTAHVDDSDYYVWCNSEDQIVLSGIVGEFIPIITPFIITPSIPSTDLEEGLKFVLQHVTTKTVKKIDTLNSQYLPKYLQLDLESDEIILDDASFTMSDNGDVDPSGNTIYLGEVDGYKYPEDIKDGAIYKVIIDGDEYICKGFVSGGDFSYSYIGSDIWSEESPQFPFSISWNFYSKPSISTTLSGESHVITIETIKETITPLKTKYLPEYLRYGEESVDSPYIENNLSDFTAISSHGVADTDPVGLYEVCDESIVMDKSSYFGPIILGEKYLVIINNNSYITTAVYVDEYEGYVLATNNKWVIFGAWEDGRSWLWICDKDFTSSSISSPIKYSISHISEHGTIDAKYLPEYLQYGSKDPVINKGDLYYEDNTTYNVTSSDSPTAHDYSVSIWDEESESFHTITKSNFSKYCAGKGTAPQLPINGEKYLIEINGHSYLTTAVCSDNSFMFYDENDKWIFVGGGYGDDPYFQICDEDFNTVVESPMQVSFSIYRANVSYEKIDLKYLPYTAGEGISIVNGVISVVH